MFKFVDEPKTCKFPDTNTSLKTFNAPDTVNAPVIAVSVLTLKPFKSIAAELLPLKILFNCKPVTPDAGMLYKPAPFPTNEPVIVPEPVILPVTTNPVLLYVNPL